MSRCLLLTQSGRDEAGRYAESWLHNAECIFAVPSLSGNRRAPQRPAAASKTPSQGVPQATQRPSGDKRHSVMSYQSRVAKSRLPSRIVNIAGIDVAMTDAACDLPRHPQSFWRRRRTVHHLPVRMKRREVQWHVWTKMID